MFTAAIVAQLAKPGDDVTKGQIMFEIDSPDLVNAEAALITATGNVQQTKGQLDLERHGGRTPAGVYARIAQRLLAMAAAIWHNWLVDAPDKRSLIAYDH